MTSETNGEAPCLERLHREAITCLETFPNKIIELNDFVNEYMPESVKSSKYDENIGGRKSKCQNTLCSTKNWDLNSISDYASSYYSLPISDRGRSRHGVCKRRSYRSRGLAGLSNTRRRPGPLGQLLAFIVGSLATCTKKIVIDPSQYIIHSIISTFFQRRELKNVQCGPSPNWDGSTYVATLNKDTTIIGKLIDVMRPAAVKLIADITTSKRWLQAVTLYTASPSTELTSATRCIETIDCWAYELFFHLKYLQVNRAPQTTDKVTAEAETKNSDVMHINLWHRLAQLRDNYIILYDTLQTFDKVQGMEPEKPSE